MESMCEDDERAAENSPVGEGAPAVGLLSAPHPHT